MRLLPSDKVLFELTVVVLFLNSGGGVIVLDWFQSLMPGLRDVAPCPIDTTHEGGVSGDRHDTGDDGNIDAGLSTFGYPSKEDVDIVTEHLDGSSFIAALVSSRTCEELIHATGTFNRWNALKNLRSALELKRKDEKRETKTKTKTDGETLYDTDSALSFE